MKIDKISLEETGQFSKIFLDYINQEPSLKPFYGEYPSIENFESVIKNKKFTKDMRATLHKVLMEQYVGTLTPKAVEHNIHSLDYETTFTVTTGHQLNIFTGPLYFIYKIVSTINLARRLKQHYPQYHFVPVYWMASEDHDFDEISYFNLFGKKYKWETDQKGAVGKFRPQSLGQIIAEMPESVEIFEQAYLDSSNLADAVRSYVTKLFGDQGLVVLDGDHPDIKAEFAPIIKDDLFNHSANRITEKTTKDLENLGYSSQIFPREINFFYLNSNLRSRYVQSGDQFEVLESDMHYTREELDKLVDEHPEKFSPNVVMRPLYQEMILPNVAYIGGPSEVAYWLQLKGVFDHYNVQFPCVMPRNFCMYIDKPLSKKLEKLDFSARELFKETHLLKEQQLKADSKNEIELGEEKASLAKIFHSIEGKTVAIDKSLQGFIGAMQSKVFKDIENIEKKLKKAEEQNHDTAMMQIENVKEKLFPGGTPQERHDNFLNFYLNNPNFIHELLSVLDPLDFHYMILEEEILEPA